MASKASLKYIAAWVDSLDLIERLVCMMGGDVNVCCVWIGNAGGAKVPDDVPMVMICVFLLLLGRK